MATKLDDMKARLAALTNEREKLHTLAKECNCGVVSNEAEGRYELTRR